MLRGRAAEIPLYDAETLQADRSRSGLKGSPTQVVKTYTPPMRGQAEEICGSPEEKAQAMARICKEVLYGAN
jgi:electron transfer flavoprotein beta subunit